MHFTFLYMNYVEIELEIDFVAIGTYMCGDLSELIAHNGFLI